MFPSVLFLSVFLCKHYALCLLYFADKCSKRLRRGRRKSEMKQDELRRRLIDGTIHVIAQDGLDKATTKQIGIETSINQAYIYRCFEDKEDMLKKTFEELDLFRRAHKYKTFWTVHKAVEMNLPIPPKYRWLAYKIKLIRGI
jgi:hypothetical protein